MANLRPRRPSPAMVVACLALAVSLGGTAVAATTINGGLIKNRTIGAKKIKKNALTGTEIRESSLGKVPKATKADSATLAALATNALTLGGYGASHLTRVAVKQSASFTSIGAGPSVDIDHVTLTAPRRSPAWRRWPRARPARRRRQRSP